MDFKIAQLIIQDQSITYALTDRTLRIVDFNGSTTLLGCPNSDPVGMNLFDCVPELVGNQQDIQAVLDGVSARFELAFVNREVEPGKILYTTLTNLPYVTDNQEIVGILHIVKDVSAIARAEQEMLQQRNELFLMRDKLRTQNEKLQAAISDFQKIDALKSQFTAVAAHELRNPISTILLYTRMLLEDDASLMLSRHVQSIAVINRNAERLARLTSNMMELLRLELGQIELTIVPHNLAEIVAKVQADLEPMLKERSQSLHFHSQPALPNVLCDEDRTLQILSNLLHNASKYSPDAAAITLDLRRDENPKFLHLAIIDRGLGIPKEELPRLFEQFYRASNAHNASIPGSGLGLSIVYPLVQLHGGSIWFESEVGQGTTVHLLLQAAER